MMKIALTLIACASAVALIAAAGPKKPAFTLASATFAEGAAIPQANSYDGYGCTGKNLSPELHWSGTPIGTKSFALTIFDPDANAGKGWWHWVVYGIDPTTKQLAEGEPSPGLEGTTDFGKKEYGGPCPPVGDAPHHYMITLYALDATVGGSLTGPALLKAIDGHVLDKAVLMGRFGRP
jgi:hypothetical protein